MYANAQLSAHSPLLGRLAQLFSRVTEAFQPAHSPQLPVELQGLSDRLLRDIGVERGDLPPALDDLISRADMLDSRSALQSYLSASTR
jgi:hypothetical protein